jgi:PIN domain nuclease of toxin-antitoxin system
MKLLLDTHAFIWWSFTPDKLSDETLRLTSLPDNTLYLSLLSVWEIQIKVNIGKLDLPLALPEIVSKQIADNGLQLLDVRPEHIYELENLPMHHRDPFDRLLLAQASVEGLVLVSKDEAFTTYSIPLLW